MKQANPLQRKLLPVILTAAMLISVLSGCVPAGYVPAGYVPEGYVPAGYISIEDAKTLFETATLSAGAMDMDFQVLSDMEADQIQQGMEDILQGVADDMRAGNIAVNEHDWGSYASTIAKKELSFEEAALYDRFDEACLEYLTYAIDGYLVKGSSGKNIYYVSKIRYDDLNLTSARAQNVYYWFKFNNPQYYFLTNGASYTDTTLYPNVYEKFADGDARVKTTNELFDKLDSWIATVNDGAATTWQKELAANSLLCDKLDYNYDYADTFDHCQSLYSAVMEEYTICAGYAEAFSAIMNASGVNTAVSLSSSHAWNAVLFDDGNYYGFDVCWNDTGSEPTRYVNLGETSLKARDNTKESHTYRSDLSTWQPVLSKTDYSPTEYDQTGTGTGSAAQLGVPANLHVIGNEDGKIYFEWDPVEGAEGYAAELYSSDLTQELASERFQDDDPTLYVTYGTLSSFALRVRAEATVNGADYASAWSDFLIVDTGASGGDDSSSKSTLAAPQNVKTIIDEPTVTSFSWDAVSGAEQYQVILFKDAAHTQTWLSCYRTTTSTGNGFSKLQPSTTYYYGIRAMKTVDGEDIFSDWTYYTVTTPAAGSSTTLAKPAAPTGLQAVSTAEQKATISWNEVSGATGYEIKLYKDADHKELSSEFSKTVTTLNLVKMTEGKTYYIAVRAVATSNGQEVYSDWTYLTYTQNAAAATLAKPANVTMVQTEETKAKQSWDSVPGATGYQTYCTTSSNTESATLRDSSAGTTSRIWSPMTAGKTYYYGVRAVKEENGETIYSEWVESTYTHQGASSTTLSAPANVTMVQTQETSARMSWDLVPGATGYQAYCTTSSNTENATLRDYSAETASRTWGPMTPGKTYYYGVRAVKEENGETIYSEWVASTYTQPAT